MSLTEKERLLKTLAGESVDRPPVICPGGMMTMACREVMHSTGCCWPHAHRDPVQMATLSAAMRDEAGIENVGIPFCMTVEAEAWGGEVEDGDEFTEPCMVNYPLKSVSDWRGLRPLDPKKDGRLPAIIECTRMLRERLPDTAVIGNLVGPLSLASSLIDAMVLYKALIKEPEETHRFMEFIIENSVSYGKELVKAGADVMVIADPSATGEILGPRMFGKFAVPYLNRMTDAIHAMDIPVIIHICGDANPVFEQLKELKAECISFDSLVNVKKAIELLPGKRIMGNVSTILLQKGPEERIRTVSKRLLDAGVNILAPACGISSKTPVAHMRALTETAKRS